MSDSKLDYNKKMIGQKVKVIENHNFSWIGEIKEVVDESSFLVKDSANRDKIVSMYDIRSVDLSQLAQAQ
jgi:RNase P/RNase MRP subunit p29|tara:strand:+ start:236 stop:445 length:210 start_codon:yes stop_codon:yes gene_type:complete